MDVRAINSDLLALQKLYGLLKSPGDGTINPASNMLDDHARVILKHFLDSATQRALKVYFEILAGQVGVSRTQCASRLQQTDNTIKEQSSPIHMTREVDQSYRNDLRSEKERKMAGHVFNLWNDQRLVRQSSQVDSIEQSTPSADATRAEFRKKCCRVCQRRTVKQMAIDDTAKFSDISTYPMNEVTNHSDHVPWNIERETASVLHYKTNESKTDKRRQTGTFVTYLSGAGSTAFSSGSVVPDIATVCKSNFEAIYKREEADSISKEALEAIEQLESCISDLKIGSGCSHLVGEFSGKHENMDSNDMVYKLTSQSAQSPLNYPSHKIYGVSTEVINQPLVKVQPTNTMFCPSGHFSRSVGAYGMRVSNEEPKMPIHGQNTKAVMDKIESGNWRMTHDFGRNLWNVGVAAGHETSPWLSTFLPVPKMESPHHLAMKNERNIYGVFQPSKPANSTFGNQNYSEKLRSIDSSSYGSVGEDYSFSDQTGSHYITSSTSSESGASLQSHGTRRDYDSRTSKSEDDLYSSTSGDGTPEVTSSSSGKSEGCSSYNHTMNHHTESAGSSMKSTSRKKVPGRNSKSPSGINHEKASKPWKRFKDRLGVIYHRHDHHHHHHHDNHDGNRQGSNWKKINVGTLFKKHDGKIIRSKQGDDAYGEMAVGRMRRKSLIHDTHQKGHFHGLVEAFLRHIWHSKNSKLAKGTSDKLAKSQRGQKKTLKKSRRWKLLQHHRRGRFPKKTPVRLGFGQTKKHLKALRS